MSPAALRTMRGNPYLGTSRHLLPYPRFDPPAPPLIPASPSNILHLAPTGSFRAVPVCSPHRHRGGLLRRVWERPVGEDVYVGIGRKLKAASLRPRTFFGGSLSRCLRDFVVSSRWMERGRRDCRIIQFSHLLGRFISKLVDSSLTAHPRIVYWAVIEGLLERACAIPSLYRRMQHSLGDQFSGV